MTVGSLVRITSGLVLGVLLLLGATNHEAQLWVLRNGEVELARRGVRLRPEAGAQEKEPEDSLSPFYRAGFVLSGDWR